MWAQLMQNDVSYILVQMPKPLRDMLDDSGGTLWVGGGCIRALVAGERLSDWDVFGTNAKDLQDAALRLHAAIPGCRFITTRNAYTLARPGKSAIQFIHRWVTPTPEEMMDIFDFTIAQASVVKVGPKWLGICSPRFYADLAGRRLIYTSPAREEEPGGSMVRARKFMRRGYDIPLESLGALCSRLVSGVRDGADFWTRSEEHRTRLLTALLREVDPLTVIDGEIVSDPADAVEDGDEATPA